MNIRINYKITKSKINKESETDTVQLTNTDSIQIHKKDRTHDMFFILTSQTHL